MNHFAFESLSSMPPVRGVTRHLYKFSLFFLPYQAWRILNYSPAIACRTCSFLAQHGNWEDDHRAQTDTLHIKTCTWVILIRHHQASLREVRNRLKERAAIRIRARRHRLSSSRYRFQRRRLCWIDASSDACSPTDRSTLAPITCIWEKNDI